MALGIGVTLGAMLPWCVGSVTGAMELEHGAGLAIGYTPGPYAPTSHCATIGPPCAIVPLCPHCLYMLHCADMEYYHLLCVYVEF